MRHPAAGFRARLPTPGGPATAARGLLPVLLAVLGLVVGGPPSAGAQEEDPLRLSVEEADGSVHIQVGNLLDDGGLVRALHSGLPLRVLVVAELWKDGFFDSQRGRAEWRATVVYDPLEERYRVATAGADTSRVVVDSLAAVAGTLQDRFSLPLRPTEGGRFYYLGEVVVETLSLSDLEELQQWLRGDLAPAVSGESRVEDAVGSGVRRMLVRMLGLPARRVRVRSPSFEVDPLSGEDLPTDGELLDEVQVRLDADPRAVGHAHRPVPHLELRLDHVPLPVATAGRDVPGEGEPR